MGLPGPRRVRLDPGVPRYPCDYGLGDGQFTLGELRLASDQLAAGERLDLEVGVTHTSGRGGPFTAQLYVAMPE